MKIEPVREFTSEEVRAVRAAVNMTQTTFAAVLGVSKKAVEAWECGQNVPSGPASRLISMMEADPTLPERFGILAYQAER